MKKSNLKIRPFEICTILKKENYSFTWKLRINRPDFKIRPFEIRKLLQKETGVFYCKMTLKLVGLIWNK